MKKISKRHLILVLGISTALICLFVIFAWQKSPHPPNKIGQKVRVKGFEFNEPGQISCLAQVPECGYCRGEIIDKNCYVEVKN